MKADKEKMSANEIKKMGAEIIGRGEADKVPTVDADGDVDGSLESISIRKLTNGFTVSVGHKKKRAAKADSPEGFDYDTKEHAFADGAAVLNHIRKYFGETD